MKDEIWWLDEIWLRGKGNGLFLFFKVEKGVIFFKLYKGWIMDGEWLGNGKCFFIFFIKIDLWLILFFKVEKYIENGNVLEPVFSYYFMHGSGSWSLVLKHTADSGESASFVDRVRVDSHIKIVWQRSYDMSCVRLMMTFDVIVF